MVLNVMVNNHWLYTTRNLAVVSWSSYIKRQGQSNSQL